MAIKAGSGTDRRASRNCGTKYQQPKNNASSETNGRRPGGMAAWAMRKSAPDALRPTMTASHAAAAAKAVSFAAGRRAARPTSIPTWVVK
jgi:hypothetical protein